MDKLQQIEKLQEKGLPLGSLMKVIRNLENSGSFDKSIKFGLSSNITIDQLGMFLKKQSYIVHRSAEIIQGGYDSHLANIDNFIEKNVDTVVLINFFDNLVPSFEAQLEHLDDSIIQGLKERFTAELEILLDKGKSFKSIYITLFNKFNKPTASKYNQRIEKVILEFNEIINDFASRYPIVKTLNIDAIVTHLGYKNSYDHRFYYKFKAPFKNLFLDELAREIVLESRGLGNYYYKAIVLDCDNTLWKGVIGEDLLDGIKLSPYDYPGNVFWYAQQEILKMQKSGMILCLCSKNNPQDVDDVLINHPHQVIKDEHLIIKKVNWNNKAQNLQEIAQELNIGLDSLIFLDDSSFECESVRSQLPMVKTLQVPKNPHEYFDLIHDLKEIILSGTISKESAKKTEQYKNKILIEGEKKKYDNQDDYLKSLCLKATLMRNNPKTTQRVSELTQKSNQFNLTTKRYSVSDIEGFIQSDLYSVYTLDVSDKFGDSGLTGIAIVRYEDATVIIDSFLMSCRVIGRGVEFAFWKYVLDDAEGKNCKYIQAEYIKSNKNEQVCDFYDRLGIPLQSQGVGNRSYYAELSNVKLNTQSHVEIIYEK